MSATDKWGFDQDGPDHSVELPYYQVNSILRSSD
jgi:hypothetical protein